MNDAGMLKNAVHSGRYQNQNFMFRVSPIYLAVPRKHTKNVSFLLCLGTLVEA